MERGQTPLPSVKNKKSIGSFLACDSGTPKETNAIGGGGGGCAVTHTGSFDNSHRLTTGKAGEKKNLYITRLPQKILIRLCFDRIEPRNSQNIP